MVLTRYCCQAKLVKNPEADYLSSKDRSPVTVCFICFNALFSDCLSERRLSSFIYFLFFFFIFFLFYFILSSLFSYRSTLHTPCKTIRCCMVKTHGKLVSVSFIRHRTSTSDLSTSSSRTYLQVACATGMTYLRVCFPLRCFQRLSVPNLATGRCHWHDNPYTRGSFTPVLSY